MSINNHIVINNGVNNWNYSNNDIIQYINVCAKNNV